MSRNDTTPSSYTNSPAPVAQNFDTLSAPPPLAIVDISRIFIREQALAPVMSYLNQTLVSMKRAIDTSLGGSGGLQGRSSVDSLGLLHSRDDSGQCSPGNPCPDGSCCNNDGGCGYGSENCGSGNCSSNCRHARLGFNALNLTPR